MPSRTGPPVAAGRWSLLPEVETDPTRRAVSLAEVLLDRHGVVIRGAVVAERAPGGFAAVYRVLATFEETGRCRRGYFVEGLGAAQFALPGAVDRLRAVGAALERADEDPGAAAGTVLDLLAAADGRVDGIKLSVLDDGAEVSLRRRLPPGVRLYTGDDLHYDTLIKGGPDGHSDALLGAFSAVTAPAAAALAALDRGDEDGYDAAIGPTMPVSRLLFEPPASRYKAGIAFLAWLNGLQPHFAMPGGFQRQRPASHLIAVFELAAEAGVFRDPDLAAARVTAFLAGLPQ
jgi:hypothetical protein